MNGRRAKLLKRRGETIVELREYNKIRGRGLVFTDPVRRLNKALKRQWTRHRAELLNT